MKSLFALIIQFAFFSLLPAQVSCDAEYQFTAIQENASGLATDGNNFWVSGLDSDGKYSISLYDETGNYLETLYPDGSFDINLFTLTLQEDTLWGVYEQMAKLYKINKVTGEVYDVFDLPHFYDDPNNWGLAFGEHNLFVVEYGFIEGEHSFIYKINPTNGEALDTTAVALRLILPVEIINGVMIGLSKSLYKLFEINLETGEFSYLLDWCIGSAWDIAFNPQGELFGIGRKEINDALSVYKIYGLDLNTAIPPILTNDTETIFFPNPTRDVLNVNTSKMNSGTLTITNSLGAVSMVGSFQNNSFEKNISNLAPGMYYIHLTDGKNKIIKKIIKI